MKIEEKLFLKMKNKGLFYMKTNGYYCIFIENDNDFIFKTQCKGIVSFWNYIEYNEIDNIFEEVKKEYIKFNYEKLKNSILKKELIK